MQQPSAGTGRVPEEKQAALSVLGTLQEMWIAAQAKMNEEARKKALAKALSGSIAEQARTGEDGLAMNACVGVVIPGEDGTPKLVTAIHQDGKAALPTGKVDAFDRYLAQILLEGRKIEKELIELMLPNFLSAVDEARAEAKKKPLSPQKRNSIQNSYLAYCDIDPEEFRKRVYEMMATTRAPTFSAEIEGTFQVQKGKTDASGKPLTHTLPHQGELNVGARLLAAQRETDQEAGRNFQKAIARFPLTILGRNTLVEHMRVMIGQGRVPLPPTEGLDPEQYKNPNPPVHADATRELGGKNNTVMFIRDCMSASPEELAAIRQGLLDAAQDPSQTDGELKGTFQCDLLLVSKWGKFGLEYSIVVPKPGQEGVPAGNRLVSLMPLRDGLGGHMHPMVMALYRPDLKVIPIQEFNQLQEQAGGELTFSAVQAACAYNGLPLMPVENLEEKVKREQGEKQAVLPDKPASTAAATPAPALEQAPVKYGSSFAQPSSPRRPPVEESVAVGAASEPTQNLSTGMGGRI